MVYIDAAAKLDEQAFVFRRSAPGTVFQKDARDARFFHRSAALNEHYANLMSFEDGDEVVQVGYLDLLSLCKFALRRTPLLPAPRLRPRPSLPTAG